MDDMRNNAGADEEFSVNLVEVGLFPNQTFLVDLFSDLSQWLVLIQLFIINYLP